MPIALDLAHARLLDGLADAAIVCDSHRRIHYWNAAAAQLYGVPRADALDRDLDALAPLPPEALAAERGPWRGHVTHHHRDGTPIAADAAVQALPAENGAPEGLRLCLIRTLLPTAPEHPSLTPLGLPDRSIDAIPIGVAVLDSALRVRYLNAHLAAAIEGEPAQQLGRTVGEVVPHVAATLQPHLERVLTTGKPSIAWNLPGLAYPGASPARLWVVLVLPYGTVAGALDGVVALIFNDEHFAPLTAVLNQRATLLDQAHVFVRDIASRIIVWNTGAERLYGWTAAQAVGQVSHTLLQTRFPVSLADYEATLFRADRWEGELIHRRRDGSELVVASLHVLIRDADGIPTHILEINNDVTERVRAERALRRSEENLRAVVEGTDSLIWGVDREYRLILSNTPVQSTSTALYGRAPAPGEHMLPDMIPEVRRSELRQHYDRALAGERFTITMQTPIGGALRTVEYHYSPMHDNAGTIIGATVFGRDITERLQAEQALREQAVELQESHEAEQMQEARLGSLLNHAPIGISLLDRELRFQHINTELAEMNGQPVAAHLGRTLREVLPAFADALEPIYHQVIDTGEPLLNLEISGEKPGEPGVVHTWQASYFPVRAAGERIIGAGVVVSDITERRQAEDTIRERTEALSRANADLGRALKLKDEFLAMMSHELRTPLNAVLGFADLLAEGIYGELTPAQNRVLGSITESGRHLLAILSDILDMTQIEAGGVSLDRQPIDVIQLGRKALQVVQGRAEQKRIQLMQSVAFGAEALRGDERRLTQILTNLLDNAVKFTPEGGTVGLEVIGKPEAEQILFTVWDTGIGIAAEDMDRLFKPFTQVDGNLSRAYGGIGLGLTLVRRLAELHGGSVTIESVVGQGSRFTAALPWRPEDNLMPTHGTTPVIARHWATPPEVLVADDDELTVALFTEALTTWGYRVTAAHTGLEALDRLRAQHFDAVIIDIQMPNLDGLSVIRRARGEPATASLPILAVTALALPGDRERCLEAGATRYLPKPISARVLYDQIEAVLGAATKQG